MEEIDQVREAEEANYRNARGVLGESVSLVQELVDLYKLFGEMIKQSGVGSDDEIVAASTFLLACRYQLAVGALALVRGHLTDSFSYARKAIELCAFAARVKRHPHLAMVWLSAGRDDASYEKFREKFSGDKLFPKDHTILEKLRKAYDHCSKLSHPSVYSFAGRIKTKEAGAGVEIEFDYFEVKRGDPSEPIRTLLWVVDTHFSILQVYEEVLEDVLASDRKRWEIRRNAVEGRIVFHKEKWKSVCMRGGDVGLH